MTSLSVVVPARDEVRRLPPTLDRIIAYLDSVERSFELLVVDDGSSDGTFDLVAARSEIDARVRALRLDRPRGKGAAVRLGALASRGARVLICDADLSTPIEAIEPLDAALDAGAAIAVGSRRATGAELAVAPGARRLVMSRVYHGVVVLLGLATVRDHNCGFKLLTRAAADTLFPEVRDERFVYDVELLYRARRAGFALAELPVVWTYDADTRITPGRDAWTSFVGLVRLRGRLIRSGLSA